jgi:hypothetical protein
MNQATTVEKPRLSVVAFMAERYGMEMDAFERTVRATCSPAPKRGEQFRPLTREEFAAFLLVAREYKLNPITREIFAYPKRGGGVVPIVSIDGWVNLVNSHPACDGFQFEWDHAPNGELISCTCIIYRKDRTHPTSVTEYFVECFRDTEPWKMAHRMLRHKALIQCARYAFGFAGIYDEEEGQRIAENRVTALPDARPAPRPPRPGPSPSESETRAVDPSEGEGPIIEGEHQVVTDSEADPETAFQFFDELRDRLGEAKDAAELEEIWTEFDPMARFEGDDNGQEICLSIKSRKLRSFGEKEENQ